MKRFCAWLLMMALMSGLVQLPPASAAEPTEDMVLWYKLDESSGSLVTDSSGKGNNGSLIGGAAWGAEGLEFGGTNGYIKVPDNILQGVTATTVAFQVYIDAAQSTPYMLFGFGNTGSNGWGNGYFFMTGNEFRSGLSLSNWTGEQQAQKSQYNLPRGVWKHVAITIAGNTAILYEDGQEAARNTGLTINPSQIGGGVTTANYIGKSVYPADKYFKGKMKDFRMYNRALGRDEIKTLAQALPELPPENPPSNMLLHYDMKNVNGTTVEDVAGNYDGTWVNPQNAKWVGQGEAGAFSFAGGSAGSYVEIPQGVLNGLKNVTVSALVNWKGEREAEWIFALGQDQNKYLFATPKRNSGDRSARAGLGITSWNNEAGANASTGPLTAHEWKLVTVVMSGDANTIKLYIDGVEVAADTAKGYTLAQINNSNGRSGFVGKSFYAEDPYFGGMIADFRIYGEALTAGQVAGLRAEADGRKAALNGLLLAVAAENLDASDILGDNASPDQIDTDLVFPAAGDYGTTITWTTDKPEVISNAGVVTRPVFEAGDQTVVVTATLFDGTHTMNKSFTVTVIRRPKDTDAVQWDADSLVVHNIRDARGNLTLPTSGRFGSAIAWTSDKPSIITPTGEVNRPEHGESDSFVKLTATITLNAASVTKTLTARVRPKPEAAPYEGYMFTYFTGEGASDGEQIYLALSEGNDALHWRDLNGGNPVLTSVLGEKGVRDPYIIRSPEGDKFYLIATDLKIYGNWNWGRAQTDGSRSIMVWESTDLINWSEQRMVEVAPPEAGNTWAPEVFYDSGRGEYVVFWASNMFADSSHTGGAYQKILYATTRDFYTFSEPKVYMDYGYSIIDTTMIEHNGTIYRFTKDERSNTSSTPNGKFVFQESGNSVTDPNFKLIKEGIGKGSISAGEGPTVFKSNVEQKWYLFIDEFGGRGYVPFETTDLNSGNWMLSSNYQLPAKPRHGTVLPVTKQEYERLLTEVPRITPLPSDTEVTGVTLDRTEMSLVEGETGKLTAAVLPADATIRDVVWSSSDPEVAEVDQDGTVKAVKAGTALITVTTIDGGFTAASTVHVLPIDRSAPETAASTDQTQANGWYRTAVTVTLNPTDNLSGVAKTEYRVGGADWSVYTGPIVLQDEGVYELQYRSTDLAGNIEDIRTLTIRVDKTVPAYAITVRGELLQEGGSFEDDQRMTFTASDSLSGLASAMITVDGASYALGTQTEITIDLAGKPGVHTAIVKAEDHAGNTLVSKITFEVKTSINAMKRLIDRYRQAGELSASIADALHKELDKVRKNFDKEKPEKSAREMEHFVKELDKQSEGISEAAKQVLTADAQALRNAWASP
ncbi:hypothetical protein GE107_19595 [Cohnella sp. CFH 77786]|uniref:immunoglobulin-like domain-containing protein n=1 Tax=Cohnella sp. CFH 77786 TaxID=2662265 RepID=UPI001C60DC8F|nr:immunoglobulin-like domain-containing protein [Cohnella sp. CFH 77786]MBW5448254.1 hypothetical protein [Cohnella sp. CFH 77786]